MDQAGDGLGVGPVADLKTWSVQVSCRGERRGYRYIDDDILSLCSAMYIDYSFWACLSISELQRKKTDLEKLLWNYPSVSPDCSKRTGM